MKVISVCQPWAWLLIHGPKRVENRRWFSGHRGPLGIHASLTRSWLDGVIADQKLARWMKQCGRDISEIPPASKLVFGAVIGITNMVDCVSAATAGINRPFVEGPACFITENPRPLTDPFRCRGQLRMFEIELPGGLWVAAGAESAAPAAESKPSAEFYSKPVGEPFVRPARTGSLFGPGGHV